MIHLKQLSLKNLVEGNMRKIQISGTTIRYLLVKSSRGAPRWAVIAANEAHRDTYRAANYYGLSIILGMVKLEAGKGDK